MIHTRLAVTFGPAGPVVTAVTTTAPERCEHGREPCGDCWAEWGVITCHTDHDDYCAFDEPGDAGGARSAR